MLYVIAPTNNDLYHNGILGQKWGQRNGPPYPLGSGAHSAREKKAGYQKSIKGSNRKINRNKAPSKEISKEYGIAAELATVGIIVGYAVLRISIEAGIKAAIRGNAKLKEHREDKLRSKLDKDDKTGLPLKKKEMTPKEDIKHTNPGFRNGEADTSNNCPFCVTAYELRRRGFDVRAGKTEKGRTQEDISAFYKENKKFTNVKFEGKDKEHEPTPKEMARTIQENILKDNSDGSRGTMSLNWWTGGGHVINYEVKDGKVEFLDGQNGKVYNINRLTERMHPYAGFGYLRTDNLTPDYEKLKKEGVIVG